MQLATSSKNTLGFQTIVANIRWPKAQAPEIVAKFDETFYVNQIKGIVFAIEVPWK